MHVVLISKLTQGRGNTKIFLAYLAENIAAFHVFK